MTSAPLFDSSFEGASDNSPLNELDQNISQVLSMLSTPTETSCPGGGANVKPTSSPSPSEATRAVRNTASPVCEQAAQGPRPLNILQGWWIM